MTRLLARPFLATALCLLGGVAVALLVGRVPLSLSAVADTSSTGRSDSTETAAGSVGAGTSSGGTTSSAPVTARSRTVTRSGSAPPLPLGHSARFTLVAGGDVALARSPDAATFSAVRGLLHGADLAIANLEGTLGTTGSPRCVAASGGSNSCFTFRASTGWAATLKQAGFTDLNVANNHALDYGPNAQHETLDALRTEQLAYDGLPGQITYLRAQTTAVAVIGCAPYRWAQNLLDITGSQALVRKAARHAPVVIVYMHAGAEGADADHVSDRDERYLGEPRGNPVAFAHAMIDAGADLVFASGPHVLRGMQWYKQRLIAYSLGNLATSHTLATDGILADSALLRVTLDVHGRFIAGSLIPLKLDPTGTPTRDRSKASLGLIKSLSHHDFPHSAVQITATGTISPPRGRPPSHP